MGSIVLLSQKQSSETSAPSINSSTTIFAPALPNFFCVIISSTAFSASISSMHTYTPLPKASPSAFITIGAPSFFIYSFAFCVSSNTSYFAVGILYFFIKSLENDFDDSICAAFLLGPNALIPCCSNASTIPADNGSSGATNTRSTF